ncbi:MAG: acyltransferase [Clostridia bacterium]|nr:acyltransferase [Clostridia bacterium]
MPKKRVLYLDVLRIISCFGVVLRHVCSTYWDHLPTNSVRWQLLCLYDSLFIFAVPVFVMISGALFLAPEKEISIRRLLGRNVLRLLTSFLFWSGLGALRLQRIYRGCGATDLTNLKRFVFDTLFSSPSLGFLLTLIGLYLAVPLLRCITKDKKTVWYFLALAFIFNSCVNFLCFVPGLGGWLYEHALMLRDRISVQPVLGYVGYFLLGHVLADYDFKPAVRRGIYALAVLGQLWATLYAAYVSYRTGVPDQSSFGYLLPTTVFISAGLFLWCREHLSGLSCTTRPGKIIRELGLCSFGVYLTHGLLLGLAMDAGIMENAMNPAVFSLLAAAVLFGAGCAISWLIRRIPAISRYLI